MQIYPGRLTSVNIYTSMYESMRTVSLCLFVVKLSASTYIYRDIFTCVQSVHAN